jgi:pimeloyl-ACP methyl ester carboxylesterase
MVRYVLPAMVAAVAVFLAWSPSTSWQDAHFSDEPFEWPKTLQYHDVAGAEGLVHRVIIAGPPAAESKGVILFAHGFPETAASWKHYLLHYAALGYHVIAPDLRNVNNTVAASAAMSLDLVADDLSLLIQSTGQRNAIVVAHDWGCGAAWAAAIKHPERVKALVVMAVPHMELYRAYNVARLPFALKDVWYFLFFGLSGPLARWKIAKDDFEWFVWWGMGTSAPNTFSKAEVARYKLMWARTLVAPETSTVTSWYFMGCAWLLKVIARRRERGGAARLARPEDGPPRDISESRRATRWDRSSPRAPPPGRPPQSLLPPALLAPGLMASLWSDGRAPSTVPTLQLFGGRDPAATH